MAVFMLETLKLSKTLKSSRDDFNVKYKNGKLLELSFVHTNASPRLHDLFHLALSPFV